MLLVLLVPAMEAAAAAEAAPGGYVRLGELVSDWPSGSVAAAATLEVFVRSLPAMATVAAVLAATVVADPYAGPSDPRAEETGDGELGVAEE